MSSQNTHIWLCVYSGIGDRVLHTNTCSKRLNKKPYYHTTFIQYRNNNTLKRDSMYTLKAYENKVIWPFL